MCEFFSCIVTRDGRLLFTEENSHEITIERARLTDNKLRDRDFVRIEVKNGMKSDYREDEYDTLPDWYSRKFTLTLLKDVLSNITKIWKEYKKIKQSARKEDKKIEQPARKGYKKIEQYAWKGYIDKLSSIKGYVK